MKIAPADLGATIVRCDNLTQIYGADVERG
jgi:hypothetical protein